MVLILQLFLTVLEGTIINLQQTQSLGIHRLIQYCRHNIIYIKQVLAHAKSAK